MRPSWHHFLCLSLIWISLSCRTTAETGGGNSEISAVAQSGSQSPGQQSVDPFFAQTAPIIINDLRYQIIKLFPLTILVTEDSLKPIIEKLVAESPNAIKMRPNKDVKDSEISNITIDLKDGGVDVNFNAKFKFRKCAGKACGWWQTVHTTNKTKIKFSIEDWVLRAELVDVKVYVDEDILNAFIGKFIKKDVSEEIVYAANQFFPQASGRDLKDQLKDRLSDYVDFVTDYTVFDVTSREDGLLLEVKNEFIRKKPNQTQSRSVN